VPNYAPRESIFATQYQYIPGHQSFFRPILMNSQL